MTVARKVKTATTLATICSISFSSLVSFSFMILFFIIYLIHSRMRAKFGDRTIGTKVAAHRAHIVKGKVIHKTCKADTHSPQ